ncbi:hypothetical protein GCM10010168_10360 [Actinoplanes ianthinogenes]|uniref:Uncharacterized protein n=1 Tax=Actinoplanes ianthinogenes TaxID=122358 RepID=A0ABN6CIX4_9ACTN|nr:hypothetical protein [Actinoplanes ianthinogenes]BCJ44223.1 hypothetical protein Aiant_48800 [Actinoplanes ianthinogenes]GGQ96603.1 hypothetical protein GCM10010168_10360 [Actinoplanes ianthinogenes]
MRKSVKNAVVVGAVLAVTTGAGAAYAAWSATGTGTAAAKATTAQALTTESVTVDGDLFPGADGDAKLTIHNPNSYPVKVTTVTGSTVTVDSGHAASCAASNITFANQTGLALTLAKGESKTFTLAKSVHMIADAEDGCQGATFTVAVSLSGVSNA